MVYGEDWYDFSVYDMWINLKNCSLDNVCNLVAIAIDHDDFRTTENSIGFLENLSLACEVEAGLASDDKLWNNQQIRVTSHNGVITLRGTLKNKELLDLTIETALKVRGVKDCKSEVTLLSDSLQ
jgi:osmotically-inducible protein OsmY